MKKCIIGGQAVLEGVMMKAPDAIAIAVRKQDGEIEVTRRSITSIKDKYPLLKIPVIRGIISFGETMALGVKSLMTSAEIYGGEGAEEYKPSRFEKFVAEKTGKTMDDVVVLFAVILAVFFSVGLFIVLPTIVASFIKHMVEGSILINLIEGAVRLTIFILYILVISRMKDIRRVFEYHGAEHKTIHCYEHEEELCVENARKYTTLHPRCGTAFLLIVMVMSIFVFSFLGWQNILVRLVSRILLLPLIAGFSYEIIRFAGRSESRLVGVIMYPGLILQKLTTREPDDQQLEVAIRAFLSATETPGEGMEIGDSKNSGCPFNGTENTGEEGECNR